MDFSAFSSWGMFMVLGVLFTSMLIGNAIKRRVPFLKESLLPTSVLGGLIILIVSTVYEIISGEALFNSPLFGGNGVENLELLTYHTLALGFIASAFKTSEKKLTKERSVEIFDSGVSTVATYLLQGTVGLIITFVAALLLNNFFPVSGLLLPFGYGQGTGQALNYGNIYENQHGFVGGGNFGLTIAALGFISAALGGVLHLNILRRRGKLKKSSECHHLMGEEIEKENEIPMQESIDKMTIQVALVAAAYVLTFVFMYILGRLLPGMKTTIFGFNFLIGVLCAMLIKGLLNAAKKRNVIRREYTNNFLLTRASNLFFDIMVVAGIAAIDLNKLQDYWGVVLILGVAGFAVTYIYSRIVSKVLFPKYSEEQFLAMYGMLTGTASTGIILLREIDGEFKTPAADNLVYQTMPAIVFGFPLMFIATMAPSRPFLAFTLIFVMMIVMNIILFRKFIFKGFFKKRAQKSEEKSDDQ